MWQRITHAIRKGGDENEFDDHTSSGDVLAGVLEQHPNLSVFHGLDQQAGPSSSSYDRPPSPSKGAKKSIMKRLSKGPEEVLARAPSPGPGMKFPISIPKKVKSTMSLKSHDTGPRQSNDTSRASQDTVRTLAGSIAGGSTRSSKRRASLDMLRALEPSHPMPPPSFHRPDTPNGDQFGSTRSILRDPSTPGTGQNVRFFSRDAYNELSPNQSMETNVPILPNMLDTSLGIKTGSDALGSAAVRISPTASSSKQRPKLKEVFGHVTGDAGFAHKRSPSERSNPFDVPDFDVSLDLPPLPPGLGFTVDEPFMSADAIFQQTLDGAVTSNGSSSPRMTSTPYRPDKGKAKEQTPPLNMDQGISRAQGHAADISMDSNDSFGQGATVFYSINNHSQEPDPDRSSGTSSSIISSGSEAKSPAETDSPTSISSISSSRKIKSRSRALSDSMFQSMLRSRDGATSIEPSEQAASTHPTPPYGLNVDPFSAHANEYWTPQSMTPVTPPKNMHSRGNSKEQNILLSLQTQLTIQTELCGQYETDLRAKDELLSIIEKKLDSTAKDDAKRKSALRLWRKKVADLERAVRYLEDEVDHSRSESVERSVIDEASTEALRMLHRQIAGLEKEKGDLHRREDGFRHDIASLENLLREQTDEAQRLAEKIRKNSENEAQLREGIQVAQSQIEMLGNVSIAPSEHDQADLQRLLAEEQQNRSLQVSRMQQATWEAEKAELETRNEGAVAENVRLQEEIQSLHAQFQTQEQQQDYASLKAELEAQWEHTAQSSERIDALETDNARLETDNEKLTRCVEELEQRAASLEIDWTEAENHRTDAENEAEDLWNIKEALEHEKAESDRLLEQVRQEAEDLQQLVQEQEATINKLEHERTYASDTITRLEDSIQSLTSESFKAADRVRSTESEAESLREQLHAMSREHNQLMEEHDRSLAATASHGGEAQMRLELLLKEKAEVEIELQTQQDRITSLKGDTEQLRQQIQDLQREGADREVKLVQVTKQREKDREDVQGLNIALDSKQQELELIKRRMGVKGTAGSTPAKPAARTLTQRRDSSVFGTPTVPRPRPSSITSDSGRDSVMSVRDGKETPTPRPGSALKSSRTSNGALSTSRSSMGPPPPPTASKPSLARSTSAKPSSTPVMSTPHRRASSATALERLKTPTKRPVSSIAEKGKEKENAAEPTKRRSLVNATT